MDIKKVKISSYPAPRAILSQFNEEDYEFHTDGLTLAEADARYLRSAGGVISGGLTVGSSVSVGSGLFLNDGSVGSPSLTFTSDTDMGFYRIGNNNLGLSLNGANVVDFGTLNTAFQSKIIIDVSDSEAFLVRKNADAQDILTVNTTATPGVRVDGNLSVYDDAGGAPSFLVDHSLSSITLYENTDINANLDVNGSSTFDGTLTIDHTNTEALLVRQNVDAGDVLTVDTTNKNTIINDSLNVSAGSAVSQPLLVETTVSGTPYRQALFDKTSGFGQGSYIEVNNPIGTRLLLGCDGTGLLGGSDTRCVIGNNSNGDTVYITNGQVYMTMDNDGGIYLANATGSSQGGGTLNAVGVYDDGTLLTDYVFEKYLDGEIDVAKWDSKVPNRIETVIIGEGDDRKEEKKEVERVHEPLRKFDTKTKGVYNPLDVEAYTQHWKDKRHLSSLPDYNKDNQKKHSLGEHQQSLIETVELQAIHISQLLERIKILEGK